MLKMILFDLKRVLCCEFISDVLSQMKWKTNLFTACFKNCNFPLSCYIKIRALIHYCNTFTCPSLAITDYFSDF